VVALAKSTQWHRSYEACEAKARVYYSLYLNAGGGDNQSLENRRWK